MKCRSCGERFGNNPKDMVLHLRYFHQGVFKQFISDLDDAALRKLNEDLNWEIRR